MKYHAENAVSSFFYYMWNAWSKEECKENVDFCSLEEFKQKMQVWWTGTDFGTLENITGLKETDHFPGNGPQAFADAVKKWWDSLDYDGKRDLYNKYNSNNE